MRMLANLAWLLLLEGLFFLAFARPLEPPLAAWIVFAFLASLPEAFVYLAFLSVLPRDWSYRRRCAAAVLLSPIVLAIIWWWFYPYGPGILFFLVGTTAYGLTVTLPGERAPVARLLHH
jgi:MFS superfamily sulfate permease-like transporter